MPPFFLNQTRDAGDATVLFASTGTFRWGSGTHNATSEQSHREAALPLMAASTRDRYRGVISNYLLPKFGGLCLRDLSTLELQRYFSTANTELAYESRDKIRDVLSSILASAEKYQFLIKNPAAVARPPPGH